MLVKCTVFFIIYQALEPTGMAENRIQWLQADMMVAIGPPNCHGCMSGPRKS